MRSIRRQLPVYSPLTGGAIARAGRDALRPTSPRARLERLLALRFEAEQVLLFGSGTQALTAAISASLDAAGRHRPVALPAYTCYDVASAAVGADATILLYDLDPETLAPDWTSVEETMKAGAGVVVLAPLYGYPFQWTIAEALAARHETILIEDAAQAAGSTWNGRPVGSLGSITTLSFGRGKGWTGGSGGAVLMRRSSGAAPEQPPKPPSAAALRAAAAVLAQWTLARPSVYGLPRALPWLHLGETRYKAPSPPVEMTRFSAALVLATDVMAQGEVLSRRAAGSTLTRELQGVDGVLPIRAVPEAQPGFLRMACRIADRQHRRRVLDAGGPVGTEAGYPATLADLEDVRSRLAGGDLSPDTLPGARTLAREIVTLPAHSRTTAADLEQTLRSFR